MTRTARAAGAALLIALVTAGVSTTTASSSAAATELRPDLVALPAGDLAVTQADGRRLLRFSTTSWNSGRGPMEIVGGRKEGKSRQKVYQRVYTDSGSYRDVLAGSFVYHPAHQHIHFEDYATYTLRPVTAPGASDRVGAKTTFCLMDTDAVDLARPGAATAATYTSCGTVRQGISVGWGDRYGSGLAGQSLDITGLPDGDYDLRIEVDPRQRLVESDETDNVSTVRLRLAGATVTPLS